MTDEIAEEAEIQDGGETQAAEIVESESSKALPSARVEELIKREKMKERQKMSEQLQLLQAENDALKKQAGSMGGMQNPVNPEDVAKLVMQRLQAERAEQEQAALSEEATRFAQQYYAKMSGGSELYEDFNEIMGDFNPQAFPQVVYLANMTDNTAAVMYDLAKNPQKLAAMVTLAERDPQTAQSQINKLSASIKSNAAAQQQAQKTQTQAPLGRVPASTSSNGQDAENLSVSDMRKMFMR